jgi:hypothetical protein
VFTRLLGGVKREPPLPKHALHIVQKSWRSNNHLFAAKIEDILLRSNDSGAEVMAIPSSFLPHDYLAGEEGGGIRVSDAHGKIAKSHT